MARPRVAGQYRGTEYGLIQMDKVGINTERQSMDQYRGTTDGRSRDQNRGT